MTTQKNEGCAPQPTESAEQAKPESGAWPEAPAPGTPAALHNQLMNQPEQHPTHIEGATEHRDRGTK